VSGFRYTLQSVLSRYVAQELAAARQHLSANAVLKRELDVLHSLEREAERLRSSNLAALHAGDVGTAGELAELQRRRLRLESACRDCIDRIDAARLKLERAKADLEHAMRQRARLERHRARRFDAYRADEARREEAELDDGNAFLPGSAAVSCEVSLT